MDYRFPDDYAWGCFLLWLLSPLGLFLLISFLGEQFAERHSGYCQGILASFFKTAVSFSSTPGKSCPEYTHYLLCQQVALTYSLIHIPFLYHLSFTSGREIKIQFQPLFVNDCLPSIRVQFNLSELFQQPRVISIIIPTLQIREPRHINQDTWLWQTAYSPSKMSTFYFLEPVNMLPYMAKFANVIKLRILR